MVDIPKMLFGIQYPDNFDQLCHAIGMVIINWAFVERNIDHNVHIIYYDYNSKDLANKQEVPRSLKNKIAFIRKSLRQKDILNQFMQDGIALMDRTATLSTQRHNMIHGAFFDKNQDIYSFLKYNYSKYKHYDVINIKLDDFYQAGSKMLGLASDLHQFFLRLLEHRK